ncbi:MAG TPA: Yip1 family protein [Verrucomicrobiae bacterium]|jgi:hypothetical protein
MKTDPSESERILPGKADGPDDGDFLGLKIAAGLELGLSFLHQSTGFRFFKKVIATIENSLQCAPVFKDLFLIVRPVTTWNRLVGAKHGAVYTFFIYLLPVLLLTAACEGRRRLLFGRQQMAEGVNNYFTLPMVCTYEAGSILITLCLLFLTALMIKAFANDYRVRNQLSQSLDVVFHAIGPMLLIQCLNAFPNIYSWLTWSVGISLSVSILYHGLPLILQPDPAAAFGLYLCSALILVLLMLGGSLFTGFYLDGELKSLENFISNAIGK